MYFEYLKHSKERFIWEYIKNASDVLNGIIGISTMHERCMATKIGGMMLAKFVQCRNIYTKMKSCRVQWCQECIQFTYILNILIPHSNKRDIPVPFNSELVQLRNMTITFFLMVIYFTLKNHTNSHVIISEQVNSFLIATWLM